MYFKSKNEFLKYIEFFKNLGMGSVGTCYYDGKNKKVIKVFHQFFEELEYGYDQDFHVNYDQEEILKFSNIKDDTFIFANDVIIVNDEVIGYTTDYVNAKSLYRKNPLNINLDELEKATIKAKNSIQNISNHGILTFDMMYNILYGKSFYIVDHDEYNYSDLDASKLYKTNYQNFCHELYYFLIEGYFDEFIRKYPVLKNMYQDKEMDILEFMKLFRKELSEVTGTNISYLKDAKNYANKQKKKELVYQRNLFQ